MALPKEPVIFFSELPDQELIDLFIKSPLTTAKQLLNQPEQKQRFWQILERNAANARLATAYKHVEQILGPAAAPPIQPQAAAAPEIPEYKPAEEAVSEKEVPKNTINTENAPKIEKLMNEFKPKFFEFMEKASRFTHGGLTPDQQAQVHDYQEAESIQQSHEFTSRFTEYLSMYRGEVAKLYLDEAALEMMFTAFGPLGDLMHQYYGWDMRRKVNWMKNPLNPNVVYYYLNALPTREAFKLLYLPVKAAWAILQAGGAPLITRGTYTEYKFIPGIGIKPVVKQGNFFTPTLKLSQEINRLGDAAYNLSGFKSAETTNDEFKAALGNLNLARQSRNQEEINKAHQEIRWLLNEQNGFYRYYFDENGKRKKIADLSFGRRAVYRGAGVSRSITRRAFRNLGRRLKRVNKDPLAGLVSLLIGIILDFTAGLALNFVRVAAGKILDLVSSRIPAINTLRAQITEFFSSNRVVNTFRIGGTTVSSFGRGLFSPTTFSSGYLGYRAGSLLFPNSPMAVAWSTGITGGLGVFYKTALNLANQGLVVGNSFAPVGWVKNYYEILGKATNPTLAVTEQNYWRSVLDKQYLSVDGRFWQFRPGPITRFANWLYDRPYARLPINGFVVADLGVKLLGWNPWVAYPSAMFADWAWQTRAAWSKAFLEWLPKTPVGQWIGRQIFSVQSWGVRTFIARPTGAMIGNLAEWGPRPFAQGIYNTWTRFKPYAATAFNPGFWMGFGLAPLLTPTLGGWAWAAGPAIGSATWMAGTRILAAVTGMPYARFASMLNPLAFTGFFIGQLTGLAFFGWNIPFWYTAIWTIGLPVGGMLLQTLAWSLGYSTMSAFLGGVLSSISGGLISIATGTGVFASAFAAWATVTSIALIAGLTIFFTYTIYAGFWVPMIQEEFAQPQSTNFSIKNDCSLVAPNKYRCCSNFSVTENISNSFNYLDHLTDLADLSYLTIDLTDPANTLSANRNSKPLAYAQNLSYTYNTFNSQPSLLTSDQYTIRYVQNNPIINSDATTAFNTYLSTPDKILQNLFTLMQTNNSVVYSMQPVFDILQKMAEEFGKTKYLLLEYETQITLMEHQKTLLEKLINQLETNLTSSNLVFSLTQTLASLEAATANNPLTDPCPDTATPCTSEQQGLKDLYNSWPTFVQQYSSSIKGFLAQAQSPTADPIAIKTSIQTYLDTLTDLPGQIDTQISSLNTIKDKIKQAQGKMDAADALAISNTNFLSFANMTPDGPEQLAAWALLEKYFPDVFKKSHTFYFIPKGTNYQVCVNVDYCATIDPANPPTCPIPADPQTICSTIKYSPSAWSPDTDFAKSCTTFTP